MLANATRICEAKIGVLYLREGDDLRFAATHGAPPAYVEARKQRGWRRMDRFAALRPRSGSCT